MAKLLIQHSFQTPVIATYICGDSQRAELMGLTRAVECDLELESEFLISFG